MIVVGERLNFPPRHWRIRSSDRSDSPENTEEPPCFPSKIHMETTRTTLGCFFWKTVKSQTRRFKFPVHLPGPSVLMGHLAGLASTLRDRTPKQDGPGSWVFESNTRLDRSPKATRGLLYCMCSNA